MKLQLTAIYPDQKRVVADVEAKMAALFGLQVSAVRRRTGGALPDGVDEMLPPDSLPDLLARSDVVVIAAPLTPATDRLIGRRELDQIKPGALLINVSRGNLVDDDALVSALTDGRLGGAALDVFTDEPLAADSPYWDMPNVIVTPHVCGAMHDYWPRLVALFAENLRRFEHGDPLLNVVDVPTEVFIVCFYAILFGGMWLTCRLIA